MGATPSQSGVAPVPNATMNATASSTLDATPIPHSLPAGTPTPDPERLEQGIIAASTWLTRLRSEIANTIIGQQHLVDRLLVGLLANGHILLEGVPGLAKTLAARTLASAIHAKFSRIQFTPDLLPSDIIGTLIYHPEERKYTATPGPVFANLVLADEINRAPAKVQSALLEAMQERQVTLGGSSVPLPDPFLVLATNNPIDQEGTYPLPEAQVDRFMLKVLIGYPSFDEERRILDSMTSTPAPIRSRPVVSLDEIAQARESVYGIQIHEDIRDYIVDIVFATRSPADYRLDLRHLIQFGASPRATIALTLAAKAWALLQGRGYVTPQDIKTIGPDVLRHRIILSYEADAQGVATDAIIKSIFETLPVP